MIPITTSENFIYGVNPSLLFFGGPIGDAFARVMALAATCEADFQTLRNLFAVPGGFGPSNRVSVSIDPTIGAKRLEGWNNGYHSDDGKSEIQIVPFPGDPNGDAAARAVFVAEMSEIFMTYRNKLVGKTWISNYSDGEALSTICEAELHPEGYYPPSPVGAPRILKWLNLPEISIYPPSMSVRPNWVDATETTDGNPWSYGCGILFINYMRFQLNIPLSEIITQARDTLAKTYENITGRTDGWSSFNQLMETYFPFGAAYNPQTDNVFPLPQLANMTISPDAVYAGDPANATVSLNAPHPGLALKADLTCGSPGYATLPSPPVVVIGQNQTSADFVITTPAKTIPFSPAKAFVYATCAGVTVGAMLTILPTVNSGILKSVTLNPAVVTSGQTSQGAVTLEAAMAEDTIVGLAATETGGPYPRPGDVSSVAQVSNPSVTVRAGHTTANFTVETSAVAPHARRTAVILAHAVVTKSAQLTVEGA